MLTFFRSRENRGTRFYTCVHKVDTNSKRWLEVGPGTRTFRDKRRLCGE
jgi:hypothetical protein